MKKLQFMPYRKNVLFNSISNKYFLCIFSFPDTGFPPAKNMFINTTM